MSGDTPDEDMLFHTFMSLFIIDACAANFGPGPNRIAPPGRTYSQSSEYALGKVKFPLKRGSIATHPQCLDLLEEFMEYTNNGPDAEHLANHPCLVRISRDNKFELDVQFSKIKYEPLQLTAGNAHLGGKFMSPIPLPKKDVQQVLEHGIAACERDLDGTELVVEEYYSGRVRLNLSFFHGEPGFTLRSLRGILREVGKYYESKGKWAAIDTITGLGFGPGSWMIKVELDGGFDKSDMGDSTQVISSN